MPLAVSGHVEAPGLLSEGTVELCVPRADALLGGAVEPLLDAALVGGVGVAGLERDRLGGGAVVEDPEESLVGLAVGLEPRRLNVELNNSESRFLSAGSARADGMQYIHRKQVVDLLLATLAHDGAQTAHEG